MPRTSKDRGAKQFLVPRNSLSTDGSNSMALVPHKTYGPHPSTERALVLRRAAYGTGEMMLAKKISGQEKLALLAEEMMRTAVRRPFNMEELLRMVDSQMGVHVDEIADLKDPASFYDDLTATLKTITSPNERPPINDTRWIAEAVGTRMHNVYLLAGSWRIVRDVLKQLEALRLDVSNVRDDLRARETVRERYLVLYDMVTAVARLGQQRLANITARSPHYAPYFVKRVSISQKNEVHFDYAGKNLRKLREAHKSFIDALILELALPNSEYPPYILMALLHDATEECRKEQGRFSQALWDAVGDFSITIQILDILEGPLLGKQSEDWIRNTRISQEYKSFLRAEELSSRASKDVEGWRQYFSPLINVRNKDMHDRLWEAIEKSYRKATGMGIDMLWSLQADLQIPPQWSTTFLDVNPIGQSDDREKGALVLRSKSRRKPQDVSKRYPQCIDESDDDGMPDLMTVSDSSSDLDPISEATDGGDVESDFNPEEDEGLQEQLKEALEAFDELLEPDSAFISVNKKSSNPFTRMFAHLKDRYFSSDPALHASEGSRSPFKSRPGAGIPARSQKAEVSNADPEMPALEPIRPPKPIRPIKPKTPVIPPPAVKLDTADEAFQSELELPPLVELGEKFNGQKPRNVSMKEVEDEDADPQTKKKKKKKKTKKAVDIPEPFQPPVSSTPSSPIPPPKGIRPTESPMKQPVIGSSIGTSQSNFSTTSLPLGRDTIAQSAHSYLQAENLTVEKKKVKTRPAFSAGFLKSNKDKRLGKIEENKEEKQGIFSRIKKIHLPKKASDLMSRLVGAAGGKTDGKKSMKWEEFLKVMRAMGFSYDPSTAGSSVRFDPPDPKDRSVTFHKPHPDPTLDRRHLREFGRKLVRRYGWTQEMFNTFGVAEGEESGENNG